MMICYAKDDCERVQKKKKLQKKKFLFFVLCLCFCFSCITSKKKKCSHGTELMTDDPLVTWTD